MNTEVKTKKGYKPIIIGVIIILILTVLALIVLFFPSSSSKKKTVSADFSAVNQICELATLKCYYHNVVEYEKEPDGLFNHGYKKFFMEYDGIVKVGVDAGEVIVKEPDKNGVVRIYVPKAKILDVDVEKDSIGDLISDTGVLTKITAEDQAKAYSEAQENMRKCAESDTGILKTAHSNAKEILKQFVINVGKQMGKDYTVEWIDDLDTDSE